VALVVEASAAAPARVTEVRLTAGRSLSIVEGTLDELEARAESGAVDPDAYLRVHVREKIRVGLGDEVRGLFPNAVDVVLESSTSGGSGPAIEPRVGRSPRELFDAYLQSAGVADDALTALFDELYEEALA
jgi:exonuclease SbcD